MKNLIKLTSELKAPKSQWNGFGKYAYRNLEDILEAFKPLGLQYGLKLSFEDKVVAVMLDGVSTSAIQSTAIIKDSNGEVVDSSTGVAGIGVRKGMDISQTYGASTSYARKYAVGALLNIDDTKDADATNKHGKTVETPEPSKKIELIIGTDNYVKVVSAIKGGWDMKAVEEKYVVSADVKKAIAIAVAKV